MYSLAISRVPNEIANLLQAGMSFQTYETYAQTLHEHGLRVAIYCHRMAEHLNLSEEDQHTLLAAAYLHDIGKLFLPVSILGKTEKLDTAEYSHMCRHPLIGQNCLSAFEGFERISKIVGQHHERVDGTGYPHRHTCTTLDPLSLILSVTDSYCAMIEDRPYKKSLSYQEADQELLRGMNAQFDQDTVRAFLQIDRSEPNLLGIAISIGEQATIAA